MIHYNLIIANIITKKTFIDLNARIVYVLLHNLPKSKVNGTPATCKDNEKNKPCSFLIKHEIIIK